ncbi:MAG TPA: glycogen debranching enzyme N-terminal domain-containing protein, partial [Verrucomicrobiae bacterium]|nr:glycogen debranching enzyme N-terminal domain-containing protein [Verrucomicrobiae bacterium]
AQAAWATTALSQKLACEDIGPCDWKELARLIAADPACFLAAVDHLDAGAARRDLLSALQTSLKAEPFPNVITWRLADIHRITPVPAAHWLLIEDDVPFRATLTGPAGIRHLESVAVGDRHAASLPQGSFEGDVTLRLERFVAERVEVEASLRFLGDGPRLESLAMAPDAVAQGKEKPHKSGLVLLTNGRGGMARLQVDLGSVRSKYDCVLGANLHPSVPVDRHLFLKRVRVWVVAEGFVTPLNGETLIGFTPGPPAEWRFVANAGDGRAVEIQLVADMLPDKNITVLRFCRPPGPPAFGEDLPEESRVTLTVRPDLLDRNFHHEARRDEGSEHHFQSHVKTLEGQAGFEFSPAPDRRLRVWSDAGTFHAEPEWSLGIEHDVERSRGQVDREDAYSPGWHELPLPRNHSVTLVVSAELDQPGDTALATFVEVRHAANELALARAGMTNHDAFGRRLALAVQAFVARRDDAKTVIAGYPWFLDWGRDSLICAR